MGLKIYGIDVEETQYDDALLYSFGRNVSLTIYNNSVSLTLLLTLLN